jgi:hypothetical protein
MVALPSCSSEDAPAVAVSTQALEAEDPARRDVECAITPERGPFSIESDPESAPHKLLSRDRSLTVLLTNEDPRAGTVVVQAHLVSERGEWIGPALELLVAGSSTLRAEIASANLELPRGRLSLSGHLTLTARIDYGAGDEQSANAPVLLYFHPSADGFEVYDSATRDDVFAAGGLDEEAAALLAVAIRDVPAGMTPPTQVSIAFGSGADGPPEADGPPDPDGEEAGQ